MGDIADMLRLHHGVAAWVGSQLEADERVIGVVNGKGATGAVFTDKGRALLHAATGAEIWRLAEIDRVTFDRGVELRFRRREASGSRWVEIMVFSTGREAADAVFDRIGAALLDGDDGSEGEDPVAEGWHRALAPVTLPAVVIKAYGAPDPRQGQKANMFVRQLPSALLAEANRDARRLARQGYFPVAMAWYDAGSEGAGLVAFNSGVKELHLVLTITYRLDAGS